MLSAAVAA